MHAHFTATLVTLLTTFPCLHAAPQPLTHNLCAGHTYRCSSTHDSIEVCNPLLGWRFQASCGEPTCGLKDGVPHCFEPVLARSVGAGSEGHVRGVEVDRLKEEGNGMQSLANTATTKPVTEPMVRATKQKLTSREPSEKMKKRDAAQRVTMLDYLIEQWADIGTELKKRQLVVPDPEDWMENMTEAVQAEEATKLSNALWALDKMWVKGGKWEGASSPDGHSMVDPRSVEVEKENV